MSSLSSLAERPALVKRLFITQEYNEAGIYKIKIFKNGEVMTVTVDDYVPCRYNGGPMFSCSTGNELWVILMEKAYAKLHGNYQALSSGFTTHAMIDLTGCPTEHINFPQDKSDFDEIEEQADEIFEKMLEADEQGYLINTETSGVDTITEGDGPGAGGGLVSGHAYSVIQVKEGLGEKLLNIRNPWGQFEWNGDWGDNSDLWTDEMIEHFEPVLEDNDGSFWMSLKDFISKFEAVNFCRVENFNEVRLKGKFIKAQRTDLNHDYVLSKFFYTFNIEEDETEMTISLHQEDERIIGANTRKNMDVGFVVLKVDGELNDEEAEYEVFDYCSISRDRDSFKKILFDEGTYAVVPLTTGACIQRSIQASTTPINAKFVYSDVERPHPYFLSAIFDVFRKMDLAVNGALSAGELNQFGRIIDSDYFKQITSERLASKEFADISCDKNGVSLLGFKQLLFRKFEVYEIREIMNKLGYDDAFNSCKSRVFMMNFQANEEVGEVEVTIHDSLRGKMYDIAWDKFMQHLIETEGYGDYSNERDDYDIFCHSFPGAYACSYALVNKTDDDLRVNLDMSNSKNCLFSPNNGIGTRVVPAGETKYICSLACDPDATQFSYSYRAKVKAE